MYKIYELTEMMSFPIEMSLRQPKFSIGFYFESIEEAQTFINLHGKEKTRYTVLPILEKQ